LKIEGHKNDPKNTRGTGQKERRNAGRLSEEIMLRITMSDSAEGAAKYFDAALATSDYYQKDQGLWGGKGAEMLALSGEVSRGQFIALASNEVPGKGQTLTVRNKEKRTPGYDFCFSVPKSISVYLAEAGDNAVERMVQESFKETMADVEGRMETRVRVGGQDADRVTGNLVYAWFVHRETRPIDGMPDPHFHIHAYVFNATFDAEEKRWKAGQFMNIKGDAPFYEAAFNARLASKLLKEGYGIRRTDRSFELSSVSRELIEKFSKRTQEIEELARQEYTVLTAKARALVAQTGMEFGDAFAQVKAELGAKTRKSKTEAAKLTSTEQLANWRTQMTTQERASLSTERVKGAGTQNLLDPELAKILAVSHLFERSSVARELHAAGMLLRRGIGRVSVDQAKAFAASDLRFIRPNSAARFVTTREVLREEADMLKTVEAGRDQHEEIGRGGAWKPVSGVVARNEEQAAAVEHILSSRDLVTSVRGVAGTGKTTMLQEAVRAIAGLSGKDVLVFAPSSSATEVLRGQGFTASETIQRLMTSEMLQDVARSKILLVDEAGFLSAKQMLWVVKFAAENECRLILCGDTRQHHGVERGDSLRVMEKAGVVAQAALTKIFRQQVPALRDAIQDLAQGRTESGFDKLDRFGAIQEIEDNATRLEAIAHKHLEAIREKKTSLVVAPTHGECRALAKAVRETLKKEGLVSGAEQTVTRLQKLNLTKSQREDAINYHDGNLIEFHRMAAGGFKSGQQWRVVRRESSTAIVVAKDAQEKALSLSHAGKFNVYESQTISLAAGDRIRITKNFQSNGKKFRNNELHTVTGIGEGKIIVEKGEIIPRGGLHIDQGFVVTSHAAQGKMVDQVIVSVPVESFSQTNEAQFHVSMSRARAAMHLFTDSKVALREAVTKPSSRLSPWELITESIEQQKAKDLLAQIQQASRKAQPPARRPAIRVAQNIVPERDRER
jgi:conjugative relaxase-like TrwC/TraI family protein